jgi:hypothetical protein
MCGGAEEIFYLAGLTQAQIVSEEFKSVHITLTKSKYYGAESAGEINIQVRKILGG